ncbi:MAG TPA: transcriptional regulator NrdR [Nitrospiria bacterium]|nr:transcriptional regulator NrdR [Nitrospiria bacterium]
MHCAYCDSLDNKVVDSRLSQEGAVIRRRRECITCHRRFTTYERIEETLPMVVKKDGRREQLDRGKVLAGLKKACEKRPISVDTLEVLATKIEKYFQESGTNEIPSQSIGEMVMLELFKLDQVAYVRFASVYREFKDINQFMEELKNLLDRGETELIGRRFLGKEGNPSPKPTA